MNHWPIIQNQAKKNLTQQDVWTSYVEKRKYQVESVDENRIVIKRLSGGEDSILGRQAAENAVDLIQQQNQIKHGQLMKNVAKECALIQFHPNISWDENSGNIKWDLVVVNANSIIEEIINEAPDDEIERISIAVNKRKYQSIFRKNLLQVYGTKCAVSEVNNFEVLEAAHILRHSESRINDSTNGILLRADLHILFDKDLLQIHPTHLTTHISPTIIELQYTQYNGKKILDRLDGRKPNEEFLKVKWERVAWTDK